MKPKRNGSRIAIDYEKVRVLAFLNPSNDELAFGLVQVQRLLVPKDGGPRQ